MTEAKYQIDIDPSTNARFRYIEADIECVDVEKVSSLSGSGVFGVNGTFFYGGNVIGIAMSDGEQVRNYGTENAVNVSGLKRGTFYHIDQNTSIDTKIVKHWSEYSPTLQASELKWAIGGYSLHTDKSYTDEEFYASIDQYPPAGYPSSPERAQGVNDTIPPKVNGQYNISGLRDRERTAIGWNGNKIILAAFEKTKPHIVRKVMKDYLGCSQHAIMLDGGGSTGIRGMRHNHVYQWGNVSGSVYSAVTENPTTWI